MSKFPELGEAIDISIPLRFDGPQPNAFSVEPATAKTLGDTRTGSSVNFEQYTFTPHCNGTHTECVGHITNERISVRGCLQDVIVSAMLTSVEPESSESDLVISRSILEAAMQKIETTNTGALIVRTLPNGDDKLTRKYGADSIPPYFTTEAMEYIVECGFKHLLVDMPSIDRLFDDGKLTNHRIFWNIKPGSFEINADSRLNSTITEMVYVPNEIEDGEYLLNIQIAPFESDCAPCRPVLIKNT